MSEESQVIALIVIIAVNLLILSRAIPNLVREVAHLVEIRKSRVTSPSPTVSSAPNFVSNSPNSANGSAHNQTIRQPKIQPFESPRPTPVVSTPIPQVQIIEPSKPVVDTPKVQPVPEIRPTSTQPATPIGAIHIPASCDNYYEVLAILPDSNESEIKAAYRSLIKIWHPDTSRLPDAQASMSAITEAYECLSQADTRKLYDEGLKLQANL